MKLMTLTRRISLKKLSLTLLFAKNLHPFYLSFKNSTVSYLTHLERSTWFHFFCDAASCNHIFLRTDKLEYVNSCHIHWGNINKVSDNFFFGRERRRESEIVNLEMFDVARIIYIMLYKTKKKIRKTKNFNRSKNQHFNIEKLFLKMFFFSFLFSFVFPKSCKLFGEKKKTFSMFFWQRIVLAIHQLNENFYFRARFVRLNAA